MEKLQAHAAGRHAPGSVFASSSLSVQSFSLSARGFWLTMLSMLGGVLLLSACSKPVEKAEEIRPVRAIVLAAAGTQTIEEFAGEIRARVESRLGFRVAGKIVARKVDVGSVVKKGQILMQLDPQDLKLLQTQTTAALRAAQSNLVLAQAERSRYEELRSKNFVSQTVLDGKVSAYQSARASYDQAVAAARNQKNQTGYADLVADVDGVVTSVDAEAGQVVTPGTPVVRVAQAGEKEVVISVPEDRVATVREIKDVQVRIWANPGSPIEGRLRELSPIADAATRTYTAKIALVDTPPEIRLGMTAYVRFAASVANPRIKVPLTALVREGDATALWVVEQGAVRLAPVKLSGVSGNELLVESGVSSGQTVVTAGVNLLKPGQKVTVLEPELVSGEARAAREAVRQQAASAAAVSVARPESAK